MPRILCAKCRRLIPSDAYDEHKRSHRGRQKNGRNGSTRSYRKARAKAIERDRRRCRRCGRSEQRLKLLGLTLETHHRDGDYRNDTPSNLITLCPDCHPR